MLSKQRYSTSTYDPGRRNKSFEDAVMPSV